MSRERKYQAGDFENYYPGRNELKDDPLRKDRAGFEINRREARGESPGGNEPAPVHKGKGPRNYRRRDERILEDLNDFMCDNVYLDASEIDVSVAQGNVVLTGTVENRASKRLAEDIAESVSGVENVENALRVKKAGI